MGPKAAYTAERLRAFGAKAVENAKKRFPDCDFACDYTGCEGAVSRRSQVSFKWCVGLGTCGESFTVEMSCRHAERGVRFPDHWRTAIPCARLCGLATRSAAELQSSVGVVSLSSFTNAHLFLWQGRHVYRALSFSFKLGILRVKTSYWRRTSTVIGSLCKISQGGREVGECISKGVPSQVVLSLRVPG